MGEQPTTLIAIGSNDLSRIEAKIDALFSQMRAVQMTPRPEWVSVQEYAKSVSRSERTVREWIKAGRIESRRQGNLLQVRA
ncbi:MerR family transcriptional regulator [Paenirhodobacter enshiensis]|uniref:Helix-turn-helix domain-containing protein n=1 Tax=Paenirhodobacter enshiensis TaxID=1105367 RepID=A0A086XQ44_9RHOB|nr:hypothetical protein [Paenirhodobacter enshiensis]KFI24144.1 hypothetical protein CG50_13795 [Paenirhodobacter enshiensis]